MDHNNSEYTNDAVDLDDLLPQIGEYGRYQKLVLFFVCLPACFPCGFGAFNQLFMSDTPDHWCQTPQLSNFSSEQQKYLGIPKTNGSYSKCKRYSVDWDQFLNYNRNNDVMIDFDVEDQEWDTESCVDGWVYDVSEVSSSIVIDFNLVCGKEIYPTLGLTALFLGGPVGVYFFGWLNDKIGRKKSFFLCLTTFLIGNVLTATALGFWWWAGSRIIVGLTVPALYQIPFIIALELVGPNYRSLVTVLTCSFFTCGMMMLALVTYLVRDWIKLTLVTSLPFGLYYFYWPFLPESPRWLLTIERFEEASMILEKLAKVNQRELPDDFILKLKEKIRSQRTKSEIRNNPGIADLFKTPNMRLKTVLITVNWIANELAYVGLSYYAPSLGNNRYLSFFLSCVIELPSYLVCWIVIDKWGRRWPLCCCMIFSGITCIATVMIPEDAVTTTLIIYLISKFAISASYLIIYPFSGELYPTELRGIGIGLSAYVGGLGLIFIPFITYLGSELIILPLIVMGIMSVIGGLTGLRLPETLHQNLPQTIEEGEEFGKNYGMEDLCRCIPLKSESTHTESYEDLELDIRKIESMESTPLDNLNRKSMLIKQSSSIDTQKDNDGAIKMTYWF